MYLWHNDDGSIEYWNKRWKGNKSIYHSQRPFIKALPLTLHIP